MRHRDRETALHLGEPFGQVRHCMLHEECGARFAARMRACEAPAEKLFVDDLRDHNALRLGRPSLHVRGDNSFGRDNMTAC
jgi:hypothetical protein